MKFEFSAGFIVVRGGKFLLLLSDDKVDTPKGHIEKGERAISAAVRELKEETGITDIKILDDFKEKETYFYTENGKTIKKTATYFLCITDEKDINLSYEHNGYKWVTYEEAMSIIKYAGLKSVIQKAYDFLKEKGYL